MVYTICEILMPVRNSTWLLGQILALSVSNTVMYYKLVSFISVKPSGTELKQSVNFFMVEHHGLHYLWNFDACVKLNGVARADFGFECL